MEELLLTIRIATDLPEHKHRKLALAVEEAATDWLDDRTYNYRVTGGAVVQEIGEADLGGIMVRKRDPETSQKSARANYPKRKSNTYKVLKCYVEAGEYGLTASELEEITGIEYRTLTPRIGYLKRIGYIVATTKKRMGNHGQDQEVKILSEFGRSQVEKHEGVRL